MMLSLARHCLGETSSLRQRISFNDNWRFTHGDPEGIGDELSYTNLAKWIECSGPEFSTTRSAARRGM